MLPYFPLIYFLPCSPAASVALTPIAPLPLLPPTGQRGITSITSITTSTSTSPGISREDSAGRTQRTGVYTTASSSR